MVGICEQQPISCLCVHLCSDYSLISVRLHCEQRHLSQEQNDLVPWCLIREKTRMKFYLCSCDLNSAVYVTGNATLFPH